LVRRDDIVPNLIAKAVEGGVPDALAWQLSVYHGLKPKQRLEMWRKAFSTSPDRGDWMLLSWVRDHQPITREVCAAGAALGLPLSLCLFAELVRVSNPRLAHRLYRRSERQRVQWDLFKNFIDLIGDTQTVFRVARQNTFGDGADAYLAHSEVMPMSRVRRSIYQFCALARSEVDQLRVG
jgi:hypothetical protein